MNRHNSDRDTAARLANQAARLRFVERRFCAMGKPRQAIETGREAARIERRVFALLGYRVAAVALALCLFPAVASAETRAPKPSVCIDFEVLPTAPGKPRVGICRDGKRPRLFSYWAKVTVDDGSGPRTVTVGG